MNVMVTKRDVFVVAAVSCVFCYFFYISSLNTPGNFTPALHPILERLVRSESNWFVAVSRRRELIVRIGGLGNFRPWGDIGFTVVWNLFAPTFDCPHSRERVGWIGDGGKWVCGLDVYEKTRQPLVVYSFGVSTDSSFELELLQRVNCEVFAYDMTVQQIASNLNSNPRVHFKQLGLGPNDTNSLRTLQTHMRENGHTWIDILKIDVEGAEFGAFDTIMDAFQDHFPFGQLQMEIHLDGAMFPRFYAWFERLESLGLRPFSSEMNLVTCVKTNAMKPGVIEYSFLNVKVNHTLVPHPASLVENP